MTACSESLVPVDTFAAWVDPWCGFLTRHPSASGHECPECRRAHRHRNRLVPVTAVLRADPDLWPDSGPHQAFAARAQAVEAAS